MTQWLRVHTALAEDLSSMPSTPSQVSLQLRGDSHSILERSQAAALSCAYHTVAHIPYSGAHTTLNQGRKLFLKNMLNKAQVEVDASESLLCASY